MRFDREIIQFGLDLDKIQKTTVLLKLKNKNIPFESNSTLVYPETAASKLTTIPHSVEHSTRMTANFLP